VSSSNGVTCNRCQQSGLGWCVSRSTRKHYLAYLVPTPVVAADGVTVTQQLRPQPNLLHRCGETIEQAREQAAQYAAERARVRALGTSPQPIATPAQVPATKPVRKQATRAKSAPAVKSTAAVGAVSAVDKIGTPIPFNAGQTLPFKAEPVKVPSADVPGKLEAAVTLTNALLAKGYPREVAAAIVSAASPAQIATLLLK
jgi:hypothetical protein